MKSCECGVKACRHLKIKRDLLIKLNIKLPGKLSRESRELIENSKKREYKRAKEMSDTRSNGCPTSGNQNDIRNKILPEL